MTTTAANNNPKRGGFLQALIRGVKPSKQQQQQQQQQQQALIDQANLENASVLTRAQKRRLSSEITAATTAAVSAGAADDVAAEAGGRRALNSLSNVTNHQQQQPQQQKRRASKRKSVVAFSEGNASQRVVGPNKKSRRAAARQRNPIDAENGFKLSQESNLGIGGLFSSSQPQQQEAAPIVAPAPAPEIPLALYQELAKKDSILSVLPGNGQYLDHYPYVLESFFMDQDLEENYRRELPLVDFLQQQQQQSSQSLSSSGGLRWDMLRVLLDWLVNAHESLELNYETLYLTVKLIYMYLSRRHKGLAKQSLQLLAISALWIASKKEELFAVQLRQLTCLTLDAYSNRQVLAMEQQILAAVEFRISWPLSYNFLRRFLRVIDHDNQAMAYLARYLLELTLLDHQLNLERESAKAAAALWLARAQLGMQPVWPQHLSYSTAWTELELMPIVRQINALSAKQLAPDGPRPQSTTFLKYSNAIFRKVALTPALPADSDLLKLDGQPSE
ncbi:hypothetical protein BOX15_Mlig014860g2 [Macrostomum lignano]|uniref:Uncharacterized protein n=2 Tax=Macrostomum lignano TaxID=282301 RepID=A0A267H0I9_9PLAT|nr:hypothetical protein BOX15_Mlig014860g2 [Macrostomum lignano]